MSRHIELKWTRRIRMRIVTLVIIALSAKFQHTACLNIRPAAAADGKGDLDGVDLDTMFKNDNFFEEFDQSVKNRSDELAVTQNTDNNGQLGGNISKVQQIQRKDLVLPGSPSSTTSNSNSGNTDCALDTQRTLWESISSASSLTDALTGLIGWSSTQMTVYPIIMILVAGVTGIFWSAVFVYIYTHFFSGDGYFGGHEGGSGGGGFFDNIFGKDKKKGKKSGGYHKYGPPAPPIYQAPSQYGHMLHSPRTTNFIGRSLLNTLGLGNIVEEGSTGEDILWKGVRLGIANFLQAYHDGHDDDEDK